MVTEDWSRFCTLFRSRILSSEFSFAHKSYSARR